MQKNLHTEEQKYHDFLRTFIYKQYVDKGGLVFKLKQKLIKVNNIFNLRTLNESCNVC